MDLTARLEIEIPALKQQILVALADYNKDCGDGYVSGKETCRSFEIGSCPTSSQNCKLVAEGDTIIIPGDPGGEEIKLGIADRVARFYNTTIGIGVILALGIITYGGVLYSVSGGNASRTKNAKDWIWAAIFGLIILLSSFVILDTINPDLTVLKDPILISNAAPDTVIVPIPPEQDFPEVSNQLPSSSSGSFWCSWDTQKNKCELANTNTCGAGYIPQKNKCEAILDSTTCQNTLTDSFVCRKSPNCVDECIAYGDLDPLFCEVNFPQCPEYACPVDGPHSYSDTWGGPRPNGRVHTGVDIFADNATPIVAPEDGQILSSPIGCNDLGGWRLWIKGDSGRYYYFAHLLDDPRPLAGRRVTVGEQIARVDTTGRPTGGSCIDPNNPLHGSYSPHLHMGVNYSGSGGGWEWPTPVADELGCTRSK